MYGKQEIAAFADQNDAEQFKKFKEQLWETRKEVDKSLRAQ
jgi:hypothetical protein